MTYKNTHNDPNRTKTVRSPEEVKAMLLGGVPSNGQQEREDAAMERSYGEGRLLSEVLEEEAEAEAEMKKAEDDLLFLPVAPIHSALSQDAGRRCPTCGRMGECCCQGCVICPQVQMAEGRVSAAWAYKMSSWGDIDPRVGSA